MFFKNEERFCDLEGRVAGLKLDNEILSERLKNLQIRVCELEEAKAEKQKSKKSKKSKR